MDLRGKRWIVHILLSLMVLAVVYYSMRFVLMSLYPVRYADIVVAESRRNALSPMLTWAVIRVESRFRPDATSSSGARGLMQIMPETGLWAAGEMGRELRIEELYDPGTNIAIGTWYLAELKREFGTVPAALAAYNGGRHNVRQWLQSGQWDGTMGGVEGIPFPETRYFVRQVMRDYRVYSWLYGRSL